MTNATNAGFVPSGDPAGTRRRASSVAGVGRCGGSVGGAAGFCSGTATAAFEDDLGSK